MNRYLFIWVATAIATVMTPVCALAQEEEVYKFANHTMLIHDIEREWQDLNLYTAFTDGTPDIRAYFLGFAFAYPNELLNEMITGIMGINTNDMIINNFVLDKQHGYIAGVWNAQLTSSVQMCYWHTTDGNVIIAVAFQGDEYKNGTPPDCDDDSDEESTVSLNDLMFYKVVGDELLWRPIPPQKMLGRKFDFTRYNIALPRAGKDITLTGIERKDGNYTLRWTGTGFTVSKK